MKTAYSIHYPDGKTTKHSADLPEHPSYAELAKILDPIFGVHMFEHVTVFLGDDPDKAPRTDMFVDENGHRRNLGLNVFATEVYRNATRLRHMKEQKPFNPGKLPEIVGPAVLFARRVWY